MISREQIVDAIRYNAGKVGKLWRVEQLPYPLNEANGSEFVAWVCAYQAVEKLKVDGQLGPKTFAAIQIPVSGDDFEVLDAPRHSFVPKDEDGPSNCIIINGRRCRLPQEMIDNGYTATNYLDDGEPKFKSRPRTHAMKWFVLHETCGNTASGCKGTLLKKGYGVQLIQDEKGRYSCHGDFVLDRMVHANQLNDGSSGCEQVNPYNPVYVRDESVFGRWIDRQWWTWVPGAKSVASLLKKKGWSKVPQKYVTLTDDQVESMKMFAPWLCEQVGVIPYEFPTEKMKKGSPKFKFPEPGIVAHQDFANHSDGRYMLEILIGEKK